MELAQNALPMKKSIKNPAYLGVHGPKLQVNQITKASWSTISTLIYSQGGTLAPSESVLV